MDEAIAKLKATAAKTPRGEWILCKLFDPALMPGQPITMQLLDSAAPNSPVWVLESNGHIAYGNSKAIAAAGIGDNKPEGRYVRQNGKVTGHMKESPAHQPFLAKLPKPTPQELATGIRPFSDNAAAAGRTCDSRSREVALRIRSIAAPRNSVSDRHSIFEHAKSVTWKLEHLERTANDACKVIERLDETAGTR